MSRRATIRIKARGFNLIRVTSPEIFIARDPTVAAVKEALNILAFPHIARKNARSSSTQTR